ncbi:hypothetical protein Glove_63g8 [Diversispora epigaea]|uniref:Uncharacterized protein n=1 Tax=Diversispora epigaea TaxID=1348612 RepID=A0A397JBB5_9GLOM|nr:hypothetical protein Glove_63g8 [Diversispora epigaea]
MSLNIIPQSEVPFLTAIYQANPQDSITLHGCLTDIQLCRQTKPKGHPKGTKKIKASHKKGKSSSSYSVINK